MTSEGVPTRTDDAPKKAAASVKVAAARGKVDLVYIDPPFDSGADYVRRVQLRGASGSR